MRWLSSIKENKSIILGKVKNCIYESMGNLGLEDKSSLDFL